MVIVLLSIKSVVTCECSLTPENENDKDGMSVAKYNEQRRCAKVRKEEAELMEVIRVELASIKGAMEYQGRQLLRQNKLLLELMSDIVEDGDEEEAREELLELAAEIKMTLLLRPAEVLEELEEGEEQEEEQELPELTKRGRCTEMGWSKQSKRRRWRSRCSIESHHPFCTFFQSYL